MDEIIISKLAKDLRLSGMVETLPSRLEEARSKNLAYEEFLSLVLQDEKQKRCSKSLAYRIKQAKFEEEKTFENLDMKRYSAEIRQIIRHLMSNQYIRDKQNVIILGPTGTGKTHLAQALGHQACRAGKKVKFIRANSLFSKFQASRADDSWKEVLTECSKTDLLILDDFGLKPLTPTQASDLYELIAEKYIHSSFIITSNRKTEGWLELFPEPVMANAALDRVVHKSFCIVLEGESYRKNAIPKINYKGEIEI